MCRTHQSGKMEAAFSAQLKENGLCSLSGIDDAQDLMLLIQSPYKLIPAQTTRTAKSNPTKYAFTEYPLRAKLDRLCAGQKLLKQWV